MTVNNKNIQEQAISGLKWSAIERFGSQGFLFFTGIVLARLIAPSDFGLLAMVSIFVAVGCAITDTGFAQVIIQKSNLSEKDLSTIFYFNIFIGFLTAFVFCWSANAIANFYSEPRLVEIVYILSLILIINSPSGVPKSILMREMRFKRFVIATTPATFLSGLLAIVLAYQGWGVWALVMQSLVTTGLTTLILWFTTEWRPKLIFSRRSLFEMLPFGSNLALIGLINSIFSNINALFIGRFFSSIEVGFYQRANSIQKIVSENFSSVLSRVLYPTFSKIQSEPERLRRVFLKGFEVLALLFFPLMALIAGVAYPLIEFLVGIKWLPSAAYLQLLCVIGAFYPLQAINVNAIKALGHSGKLLKIGILKRAISVLILFFSCRFGIVALIMGQILASVIGLVINAYYTRILLSLEYYDQFKCLLEPVVISACVYISCISIVDNLDAISLPARFGLSLAGGGLVLCSGFYFVRVKLKSEVELIAKRMPMIRKLYAFLYGVDSGEAKDIKA